MVDGFHHAGIAVSDIPRAVTFYEEVLGFEPLGPDDRDNTRETADYFWMAINDQAWVNLAHRPDATPDYPGQKDDPHLGFRASEPEIEHIKREVTTYDTEIHETATSIYFHDPDGNYLEVTHWQGPVEKSGSTA